MLNGFGHSDEEKAIQLEKVKLRLLSLRGLEEVRIA